MKFIGFKNVLGNHYHDLLRMLATRSHAFRFLSSPLWLKKLNEIYYEIISEFNPDFVLSIKGESLDPRTIKKIIQELGIRTALWYPDDPRFFSSLVRHIAPYYDSIFTYSANATNIYKSIGVDNIKRIPFGCDPFVHNSNFNNAGKVNKAIFIGTYSPKRYHFVKTLVSRGVPIDIAGPHWPPGLTKNIINKGLFGKQYVEFLQKYSLVLNIHQNINYGPNMRTFEVTGSGGVLLTDRAEDVLSFFTEGEEILTYNDIDEAQRIITEILSGGINREKIIKNAYKSCHEKYTYDKRANEILK